jgi:hypothetical protein
LAAGRENKDRRQQHEGNSSVLDHTQEPPWELCPC